MRLDNILLESDQNERLEVRIDRGIRRLVRRAMSITIHLPFKGNEGSQSGVTRALQPGHQSAYHMLKYYERRG